MTNTAGLAVLAGTSALGSVGLLAVEATGDPASVAPYVGGGVGVIAVGALAEVLRRLLNGRPIPRETKDVEEELGAAIIAAGQREDRMIRLVEESSRAMRDLADEVTKVRRRLEGLDR